jgi:hypothetical protein
MGTAPLPKVWYDSENSSLNNNVNDLLVGELNVDSKHQSALCQAHS